MGTDAAENQISEVFRYKENAAHDLLAYNAKLCAKAQELFHAKAMPRLTSFYIEHLRNGDLKETNEKELGRGGEATVFQCNLNGTILAKKTPTTEAEKVALIACNHPNIGHAELITKEGVYSHVGEKFAPETESPTEFRAHLREIVAGLTYLHKRNLVHRDIKPENILLIKEKALIIDLGTVERGPTLQTTQPVGTMTFIAPEVVKANARREDAKEVSEKVDIFAFGGLIFHALSKGQCLYGDYSAERAEDAKMQIAAKLLFSFKGFSDEELVGRCDPKESQRLDPTGELRELMLRCLRFDPVDRPAAADIKL